jgi:hypothetical protein
MSVLVRNLVFGVLAAALSACSQGPAEPTPTEAAEAKPVESTTWRPFSDDSPWNTPIPKEARTDPNSDAMIAEFARGGALYINIKEWSVPIFYIDLEETPKHDVIELYENRIGRGFEQPRAIPIPDDARPSGPASGTGYMAIVDKDRHLEWDLKQAFLREDGLWFMGFGAVTNLRGSGVSKPWDEAEKPVYAASALPSGFPLSAGLIRVDEVKAGRINHALMFAYPGVRPNAFVPPASTALVGDAASGAPKVGMPLGARIQLDPAFNVERSDLSPQGKVIARALQEYGAYLGDAAGGNVLFAEAAPDKLAEWEGILASGDLQAVFSPQMMKGYMRVVDMGEVRPGQPAP